MCLWAGLGCPSGLWAEEGRPTPTYTNEDLERMAPLRGQTGVLSKPASREPSRAAAEPADKAEAYWRKEAERLRARLRPLKRRADELRLRLKEARAEPGKKKPHGGRGSGGGSAEALSQRLESLEAEIREREDELQERARRERALPGWLR